ncbi:glycine oxidase ThiO [Paenibacillus polygoni]|uniref:glycine oxidase n=1 Tax=Paenibacillus polygoni TaxID=3050112 RepID=A0ABY8WXJ7_9BACL|nr:glycine oxidase ThiO [Paenibacillus polygoni]WIV17811.1 glycine oxidase ThiO [Paenibacillus polygoni]
MTMKRVDRESKRRNSEVLVIGGGVIGSAIAYYLSCDGLEVTQLEAAHQANGASGHAAGMLAAGLEHFSSEELRRWAQRSQQLMGPLIKELKLHSEINVGMNDSGFVVPFIKDRKREEEFSETIERAKQKHWWNKSKLQDEIPWITKKAEGALFYPQEHQLLPAELTKAYIKGAQKNGAAFIDHCTVSRLLLDNGRVTGVETNQGTYTADKVVIAAGLGSDAILRSIGTQLNTYPVKGEMVALSMQTTQTMNGETLRYTIYTPDVYIVPKPNQEIWIGATSIPYGNDYKVSASGLNTLLHRATGWVPGIGEASFIRTWAGLRPQTVDGLPYIGAYSEVQGLYLAVGHYRNGVLLSAVTGETMSRLLSGETEDEIGIRSFSASRIIKERRGIYCC